MGHLTAAEACTYLTAANGDEIDAAIAIAYDREPDGVPGLYEIHHALYLLRFAQDMPSPSYDDMRLEMRRRNLIA